MISLLQWLLFSGCVALGMVRGVEAQCTSPRIVVQPDPPPQVTPLPNQIQMTRPS